MNASDQNGKTRRENLKQVEKQTGRTPEDLLGPQLPSLVSHIWSAFLMLSAGRQTAMGGMNPLSYGEIEAWSRLSGVTLEPWELDAIKLLDAEYLRNING